MMTTNPAKTYYVLKAIKDFDYFKKDEYIFLVNESDGLEVKAVLYGSPHINNSTFFDSLEDVRRHKLKAFEIRKITVIESDLPTKRRATQKLEDAQS